MYHMTGLDQQLEKLVKEMESKHDCFIGLVHDGNNIYMYVMFTTKMELVEKIPVGTLNDSKYTVMSAIRRWFRNN